MGLFLPPEAHVCCEGLSETRSANLTWFGFQKGKLKNSDHQLSPGSRASVIATLLGIYFTCSSGSFWVCLAWGFAWENALGLNALGITLYYVKCTSPRFSPTLPHIFLSPSLGKTEIPGFYMEMMKTKRRLSESEHMSRGKQSSHSSGAKEQKLR